MANQYYTASGVPAAATRGVSASMRSEFALIQTAFDSLNGTMMLGATNGGTVNAYTLTPTTTISSYTTGLVCEIVPTITNTGASTLTISSGSAKALNSVANAALVAGDLVVGNAYLAAYNGTNFVLLATTKNYIDTADGLLAPKASPTFTGTVTAGVINGTSFNSITALSSTTPAALGTAAVGTSTTVARSDHVHLAPTTITGNAGTATTLQTARTINGTSFNGSANITVTAAADTLTGTSLNTTVLGSSLTSVGTIATGVWNGTTIAIAKGGTGATTATAGFNALAPSQTTFSGRYLTTDGTNASWATVTTGTVTSVAATVPSVFSISGSPITSSGTLAMTYSGTALPNTSGGTGQVSAFTQYGLVYGSSTTALATTAAGTTTTVLHGNAAGAPTFGAVSLTADVSGTLPIANGGTGATTATAGFNALAPTQTTFSGRYLTTDGTNASWATVATGTVTSVAATVPSVFSISGSPITSSGTLALTYSGTALPNTSGGTGQVAAFTQYGITYASTTSALATTAAGTATTVLHGNAAGAPTFGAVSLTADVSGTLPIANGGTGATTANTAFNALAPAQTTASGKYLTSDGTNTSWATVSGSGTVTSVAASVPSIFSITGSPITSSGTLAMTYSGTALPIANGGTGLTTTPTNGQLDIGNGTGFTRAALTAGSNITITNGAGSITIASTGGGGGLAQGKAIVLSMIFGI